MSTFQSNISARRIALLASKRERVFHLKDLANLWSMSDPNTLRVTLKRYTDAEILHRIYRGFYSLVPVSEIEPELLGAKAIHDFCYLTTETVLFQAGYIQQKIDFFTFVSEKSFRFHIGEFAFLSRQLKSSFLYQADESNGVLLQNGIRIATPERALADLLYFNPFYHFDRPVDWSAIASLQKKLGYPLTPHRYDFAKKN
ncbi:MAG: hypothetical protein AAB551_01900 [Patescibacteria group bacterium]